MSTNAEPQTAVADIGRPPAIVAATHDRPSLTEALTLRRNLLQSLWIGVRQLPRGRRIVLMIRLCISFVQIIAFIPILALPGSNRVSPSHEQGRVCDPDSLFKYLVVHIVRLALDIPVELYLGLSPHRTRQGRRADPEARAIAERDRPLGSEYLDVKIGKISTLLGIASLVIFFVGNAIVYSSTECSQRPADAVPLFWAALASLIVVYVFILEIAALAFLIVCALPLLIVVLRALGLTHRLPQRELHPETGKIDQEEVDKRVKLVYYTPAEEDDVGSESNNMATEIQPNTEGEQGSIASQHRSVIEEAKQGPIPSEATTMRPGLGPRQATQETMQSGSHPASGRFSRLIRILVARRRSAASTSGSGSRKRAGSVSRTVRPESLNTQASSNPVAKTSKRARLKYPLHPLPAHRATCPICLCDFEEPEVDQESESELEPEPEPLRLLECGHVMHRSCVDQWLTTVSGRCPVCQKAVIPETEQPPSTQVDTSARVADTPAPPPSDATHNPPPAHTHTGTAESHELHPLPASSLSNRVPPPSM